MKNTELIEKLTLLNAIRYKGRASLKSTLGSVVQANPAKFKNQITEIKTIIENMVDQVNALTIEQQKARLQEIDPESLIPEKKRKKGIKIELPDVIHFGQVVLRLAPFPSGPLHIGNSRMVALNDYCVKKYQGKLLLVFDDTIGSETKKIDPAAYDLIPEGLDFLGVTIHETYYKSDRLELFYRYAKDMLTRDKTYVCTCDANTWRNQYKEYKKACPCRNRSIEANLASWEKMLDGTYPEKGAAVRLKSGMTLPDPAIRDPVMLRISEREHPRVGSKYRVWPLLEFSWGIDDHDLGISHIIRGKDLRKEGTIEQMIWRIYRWKEPIILLYGRMKLEKLKLSKSRAAQNIQDGVYTGWTDPRTWSLQSLRRRGIHQEAIRHALLALGISSVDVAFSPESIYSTNRKLIDHNANRYFFVGDPINLTITGIPDHITEAQPLRHPEYPERGRRRIVVDLEGATTNVYVPKHDLEKVDPNTLVRLKDFINVIITDFNEERVIARYKSKDVNDARKVKAPMVQWVPVNASLATEILLPDGTTMIGVAEPELHSELLGNIVQFERLAFCRVEKQGRPIRMIFAHR